MKLYFSPLACSLATRIALYEAGAEATYVEIDSKTKTTPDGADYRSVHPLALVPALEIEPGNVLTENAAILQFVAERFPEARLGPDDAPERSRLRQWLSFIGTELHKAVYLPLLDKHAPADAKAYALSKAEARLTLVARWLEDREFLLDHFTVADAYLFAVLNWSQVVPIELESWPSLVQYQKRLGGRPSVARAFAEEREQYGRELARHRSEAPATAEVIDRFNDAFQRHEPELLGDLVADDCVLENTGPAPDGARHIGREACLAVWRSIASNRAARFELEGVDIMGDRAAIRWRYFWGDDGPENSLRGLNLMRVRAGRIVEGLGYVKA